MKPAWFDLAGPGSDPAAISSARRPGLPQPDITPSPNPASARLNPVRAVTSQIAPSAAKSSHWRMSGSGRSAKSPRLRPSRFNAASSTNTTPAAARLPCPEVSPGRFGLTTARQAGGCSRIRWWSMTTIFSPIPQPWAIASLAAAPQSTVTTRSAPAAFRLSNALALGP